MAQLFQHTNARLAATLTSVVLLSIGSSSLLAQVPTGTTARPTLGESISSSMKQGADRVSQAVTPKPTRPTDDPVALQGKGKPSADLYVAVAKLYEEGDKLPEAEGQYKRALQESPNDLRALLGYARLKDRMAEPQEALQLYQKAARLHPQDPSVMNNMAVHYARRGMLREAVGAMERAIQIKPKDPKYRNNMATLLIEMNRPQEALTQLRAVHDEAVAHYNLGFLLAKKGQNQAASREFALALRVNPRLTQAQQMLNRVNSPAAPGPAVNAQTRPVAAPLQQTVAAPAVAPPTAATAPMSGPMPVIRESPRVAANPMRPQGYGPPASGPNVGPRYQQPLPPTSVRRPQPPAEINEPSSGDFRQLPPPPTAIAAANGPAVDNSRYREIPTQANPNYLPRRLPPVAPQRVQNRPTYIPPREERAAEPTGEPELVAPLPPR